MLFLYYFFCVCLPLSGVDPTKNQRGGIPVLRAPSSSCHHRFVITARAFAKDSHVVRPGALTEQQQQQQQHVSFFSKIFFDDDDERLCFADHRPWCLTTVLLSLSFVMKKGLEHFPVRAGFGFDRFFQHGWRHRKARRERRVEQHETSDDRL